MPSSHSGPGTSPSVLSAVASASKGANARSWNNRMPTASRAWVRASSSWSPSCLTTIAVEDIASAPPITIAAPVCTPKPSAMPANAPPQTSICRPPMPSTSDFIATMRPSENSSPSVKTRNTMPISARSRTVASFGTRPRACGPSSMPTTQVAEDGWQVETAHEAQHQQRAGEQDQDLRQEVVCHRASRSTRGRC